MDAFDNDIGIAIAVGFSVLLVMWAGLTATLLTLRWTKRWKRRMRRMRRTQEFARGD